mgnify:CR=1 FL=1|tara:strand:+ start:9843 stop:10916 length:1074 start_codon:yes stop_codon:yes gene_type:complete
MNADMQQDIDSILERLKKVSKDDQDDPAVTKKKVQLAKIVLEDAVDENAFDGFEPGIHRICEMARQLRIRAQEDLERDEIPEREEPEPELVDIVTDFIEKISDDERLRSEELWDAAKDAIENNEDPVVAMREVLGHPEPVEETAEMEEELEEIEEEEKEEIVINTELLKETLETISPELEEEEEEIEEEKEEEPAISAELLEETVEPITPDTEDEPEENWRDVAKQQIKQALEEQSNFEPEPEPEKPMETHDFDSGEQELTVFDMVDTENVLEPLPNETELVDTEGNILEPTPKNVSGAIPVIHDKDPGQMVSIFVKEKQVERKVEQIVAIYEEALNDLDTYLQRLTSLRDAIRRRL